jgi:alkylation response protein AidB-like acyl-CoA dehydrogenase
MAFVLVPNLAQVERVGEHVGGEPDRTHVPGRSSARRHAGSETPRIKTFARRQGDQYVVNGQKIFPSRYQHSDMLLLLTRTTPFEHVKKKTDGMSLFLVNLKETGDAIKAVPIAITGPTSSSSTAWHRKGPTVSTR